MKGQQAAELSAQQIAEAHIAQANVNILSYCDKMHALWKQDMFAVHTASAPSLRSAIINCVNWLNEYDDTPEQVSQKVNALHDLQGLIRKVYSLKTTHASRKELVDLVDAFFDKKEKPAYFMEVLRAAIDESLQWLVESCEYISKTIVAMLGALTMAYRLMEALYELYCVKLQLLGGQITNGEIDY